jgi:hypothetical protein
MLDLLYFPLVDENATPDAQKIDALAKRIASFSELEKILFERFGTASVYYAEKCEYIKRTTKDDAAIAVATALIDVAKKYDEYIFNYSAASYLEAFLAAANATAEAYNALTNDAKAALGEIYNYYSELAKELTPAT